MVSFVIRPLMRILIVEDEKKMANVLKRGLEADNDRVSLAFDGRSGVELASTIELRPPEEQDEALCD